ncbi:MAG: hypothetical protein WC100_22360 [Sterolibacterium sp.]
MTRHSGDMVAELQGRSRGQFACIYVSRRRGDLAILVKRKTKKVFSAQKKNPGIPNDASFLFIELCKQLNAVSVRGNV